METAAVIWMIMLLAVAAATAAVALPRREPRANRDPATARPGRDARGTGRDARGNRHPVAPPRREARANLGPAVAVPGRKARANRRPAAPSAAELYADEVAAAADHAAGVARSSRVAWEIAQEEVDAAWAAYDAADRDARRCRAAAAFPVLRQRRTRAEIADRTRCLHRSALAACRRKELSIAQLNEVLAHRGPWNPRKHPVAQETALRAAVAEHRFAAYQAAVERERSAWAEAEKAALNLRNLRAEALAATMNAGRDARPENAGRRAEQWSPAEPVARPANARLAVH